MRVTEVMTPKVKTITVDATVADAIDALTEWRISAMPVIERSGRPVGVISVREILRAESSWNGRLGGPASGQTPVREIMAPWPPTVGPELDLREAADNMLYFDVQRLFVTHEGALIGVVSQTDIVGAVARSGVQTPR
jgi:CBS domain-containing protein